MTIKLGVVMDPIGSIEYEKDSTLALMWEAEARGWEIYYFEQKDLTVLNSIPYGDARLLKVAKDPQHWFSFHGQKRLPLADLDVILMRKDPPFNEEYIYTTYILELAERAGVFVANHPQSLRDANEKFFTTYFPQCTVPTLVAQSSAKLHEFWHEYQDIVCKPLDSMGGTSVYRLKPGDVNANAIFQALTRNETFYIMAQRFIPEISLGDKRILMIDGEPVPYALARIPQGNEWRGNLALGAKGKVQPLSARDQEICAQVGPVLRERGLLFVGLDVIGDYLSEINVTSPTCIRQIDEGAGMNVSAMLLNVIESKI